MKKVILLTLIVLFAKGAIAQTNSDTIVIVAHVEQDYDKSDLGIFIGISTSASSKKNMKYPSRFYTFRNRSKKINIIFAHFNYHLDRLKLIREPEDIDPEMDQMDIQKWTQEHVNKNFKIIKADGVPTESFVIEQLRDTHKVSKRKVYFLNLNDKPDAKGRYDCYRVERLFFFGDKLWNE